MPDLDTEQWRSLVMAAVNQHPVVAEQMDTLLQRQDVLMNLDASGELRYYRVLMDALDLALGAAAPNVATSDGGGQSGQWNQYFDHWKLLRDQAEKDYHARLRALNLNAKTLSGLMVAKSLTPVDNGYIDPGHPVYSGDPRYRRLGSGTGRYW